MSRATFSCLEIDLQRYFQRLPTKKARPGESAAKELHGVLQFVRPVLRCRGEIPGRANAQLVEIERRSA